MSFKSIEESTIDAINSVMGESVTYTPVTGSPVTIAGVFESSPVEVDGVISVKPTLRIKLSDLDSRPRKGDSVTISSVSYRVMESREDGFSGSILILQKV